MVKIEYTGKRDRDMKELDFVRIGSTLKELAHVAHNLTAEKQEILLRIAKVL